MTVLDELMDIGYTLLRLDDPSPVDRMAAQVADSINQWKGDPSDDAGYLALLEHINRRGILLDTYRALVDRIHGLVLACLGPNVACETHPRIRYMRPEDTRAPLTWHSDTFYGNSFLELNTWVLLSRETTAPVLRMTPGSHWQRHEAVEDVARWKPEEVRGRNVGLPYAPKTVPEPETAVDVTVPYGSVLVFWGCILHASRPNPEPWPRISVDWRLTPAFLPGVFRGTRPGSFTTLYLSEPYRRALKCYPEIAETDYL